MPKSKYITDNVDIAHKWVKQGKLLAYPTESVWGLGCDAFNKQAVHELLALKNRPIEKGVIVLASDDFYLQKFLQVVPSIRQNEIIKSWQYADDRQQATTWLFDIPNDVYVPKCVRGEHESLAIRVINHAKIAKLCDLLAINNNNNPFGFLVSTSCNVGGEVPASDFDTAYRYFGDKVCYLTGETLAYDKPSQIIHAATGQVVR